ncbi:hypothetical protein ACFLYP_01955 [Chloroflexota bacterium]
MNKRVLIGIIAAAIIGLVAFAVAPITTDLFAQISGGACKRFVEDTEEAGVLNLNCRRVLVYYAAGTCSGKCAAIPSLPYDAKTALENYPWLEPVSVVYVRVLDSKKEPADKLYTVCFSPRALDKVINPRILGFHPDTGWTSLPGYFHWETGDLCTNFFGESSFVLAGRPK